MPVRSRRLIIIHIIVPRYGRARASSPFAHNQRSKGDKFASRSRRCVFVCYPNTQKGCKLYDLETEEIFVSRDVKFYEAEFPFVKTNSPPCVPSSVEQPSNSELGVFVSNSDDEGDLDSTLGDVDGSSGSPAAVGSVERVGFTATVPTTTTQQPAPSQGTNSASSSTVVEHLGRGLRTKHPSVLLHDYVTHTVRTMSPFSPSTSPSGSPGSPYPLNHYVNCANFSVKHRMYLAAVLTRVEPRNFSEAMSHPGWRKVMSKGIDAFEANGTWVMDSLPHGQKALGYKWVYKIKYNSDGSVERLKARLVILGNHHVDGVDFHVTFAPVTKMVTCSYLSSCYCCQRLGIVSNGCP
ncbi:hypothetical protein LIER_34144 [Lithospermum erythrorhizon]|uniref:Reverse transcriptase Ty1/copia-type domain-containing protein n=1 Tax=Lithospermum erythrorhizon TaxID=34254 RepID=A0AAV3S395_LITER